MRGQMKFKATKSIETNPHSTSHQTLECSSYRKDGTSTPFTSEDSEVSLRASHLSLSALCVSHRTVTLYTQLSPYTSTALLQHSSFHPSSQVFSAFESGTQQHYPGIPHQHHNLQNTQLKHHAFCEEPDHERHQVRVHGCMQIDLITFLGSRFYHRASFNTNHWALRPSRLRAESRTSSRVVRQQACRSRMERLRMPNCVHLPGGNRCGCHG